jgi:hypothetical protein
MCDPRTRLTGLENVRVIGVSALIVVPGAGLATALAELPGGNQLTADVWALSQVRGDADMKKVPAAPLWGTVTTLAGAGRTT